MMNIRPLAVPDRWCVHGYYTLCPYAPDGSGRILVAGADLASGLGEVLVLSRDGDVLDRFGSNALNAGFYHTGLWQTWSPDARFVYFQSGSLATPGIIRRELATGHEIRIEGDMEGAPPDGEPLLSGLMGMLYAAGYGGGGYRPDQAPAPFSERDQHGLFEYRFDPPAQKLRLSVAEVLEHHPDRDRLRSIDGEIQQRLGDAERSTLMTYCVRWSPDGSRCLFYFGNHCVDPKRGEPRIAYIMTADRSLRNIRVAVNLSGGPGAHWSWQPDGEKLIGYGPAPDRSGVCLAEVGFDGTDYRKLSEHRSGGHPSVSPVDPDLIVTDESTATGGAVLLISRRTGSEIDRAEVPKTFGDEKIPGRNPSWVCHHPVFNRTGDRILFNHMPSRYAAVAEMILK